MNFLKLKDVIINLDEVCDFIVSESMIKVYYKNGSSTSIDFENECDANLNLDLIYNAIKHDFMA